MLQITVQLTQRRVQVARECGDQRQRHPVQNPQDPQDLSLRDLMRIANNYQNLRGIIGRVIRLNNKFVTI